jgi:ribose-phosphate pyrophosphokinase
MVGLAMQRLGEPIIDGVVGCDTIPNGPRFEPIAHKFTMLSVAPLLGEAIRRIHNDQSISALFKHGLGAKR